MANDRQKKAAARLDEVEIEPGAWERFESAVDKALHTRPKHQAEVRVGKRPKTKDVSPKRGASTKSGEPSA